MIKISVPNDDSVALFHFGKSLIDMSSTIEGSPYWVIITQKEYDELKGAKKYNFDVSDEVLKDAQSDDKGLRAELLKKMRHQAEVDTTSQQVESLSFDGRDPDNCTLPEPPTTDSTGTPWDERIHSTSKALNADGTWRLRRKPKDMDEAEWSEYVEEVKTVLLSNDHDRENNDQILEEEYPSVIYKDEPSVTPEGDDFHVDAGVVTEQQVASFPPPPPVPVFATVQEVEEPTLTFPQVMAFLTERHGRITSAQVDQIIADMGLEKITDLNTQPEHTGPFIARVKALLGE